MPAREATVIGAGIAGASVAWTLAERGWTVTVLEAGPGPGQGGSGNPAAILYPKLVNAELTPTHLQSLSFLRALDILRDPRLNPHFTQTGVLWLDQRKQKAEVGPQHPWWGKQVWRVSAEEATHLAGVSLPMSALWLPAAGILRPQDLLSALLAHPRIQLRTGCALRDARPGTSGTGAPAWLLRTDHDELRTPVLILAQAGAALDLEMTRDLPLRPVRGQVSTMAESLPLRTTLCYGGYLTPAAQGRHCLGATFQPGREDLACRDEDQEANRTALAELLPDLAAALPACPDWSSRTSLRWQTPDYLPLIGALPWPPEHRARLAATPPGRRLPASAAPQPALYASLGHGSKGFTQAWTAAEIIAAQLEGREPPVPAELIERLRPERFLIKKWLQGALWQGRDNAHKKAPH